MHKYKGLCTTKQWNYQPFVADVYGALSSQARTLLSHYMDSKLNPTVKANPGVCSEVWSGVTGDIVAAMAQNAIYGYSCIATSQLFGLGKAPEAFG